MWVGHQFWGVGLLQVYGAVALGILIGHLWWGKKHIPGQGKVIVQVSDTKILYKCAECNSTVNIDPYPQNYCSCCGVVLDTSITEGD